MAESSTGAESQSTFVSASPDEIPDSLLTRLETRSLPDQHEHSIVNESTLERQTLVLLNELDISLEHYQDPEAKKRLIDFLSHHVFDRGSINPLKHLDIKSLVASDDAKQQTLELINKGELNNDQLDGIDVLSSGMAKLLVDRLKYQTVGFLDIKNLFGANQVSRINGDRLIRTVELFLVHTYPDLKLVRWGGDELLLLQKNSQSAFPSASDTSAGFTSTELEKLQNIHLLYGVRNKDNPFQLASVGAAEKKYSPSLIERQYTAPEGRLLEDRIQRLEEFHEEVKGFHLTLENFNNDRAILERTVELVERSVYHPILQGVAEELKEQGINVQVFKDVEDFTQHFMEFKKNGNIKLLRIEWPGVLKSINDAAGEEGGGYEAGNNFLIDQFKNVSQYLHASGLESIPMLVRGSDFFVIVPETFNQEADLTAQSGHSYELDGNTKTMIPVASTVELPELTKENSNEVFWKAADIAERKDKAELYKEMISKVKPEDNENPDSRELKWNFDKEVVDYLLNYFDPRDKRGVLRLLDIGIELTASNETFYKVYDAAKQGKYEDMVAFVNQIITPLESRLPTLAGEISQLQK